MTTLDILKTRLPEELTIVKTSEQSANFIIQFKYRDEPGIKIGFLRKTCAPGWEKRMCDQAICTVMLDFAISRGDIETAKLWHTKLQTL